MVCVIGGLGKMQEVLNFLPERQTGAATFFSGGYMVFKLTVRELQALKEMLDPECLIIPRREMFGLSQQPALIVNGRILNARTVSRLVDAKILGKTFKLTKRGRLACETGEGIATDH
jgi:hypothetical protein